MTLTTNNSIPPNDHSDLLNSWKEIATYLNRGVRTVQRWEVELGLPIRRPRGTNRSAVIAMRSEIDQWLKVCPVMDKKNNRVAPSRKNLAAETALMASPEFLRLASLIAQSQELQADARRLLREFRVTAQTMVVSIRRASHTMLPPPRVNSWSSPKGETANELHTSRRSS